MADGAGADRRDAAGAATGDAGRHAGARARRSRRAGGLGGAPGADAPARGHRPAGGGRPPAGGRDPWALRLVALVALIAAGLFARDRGVEAVATVLGPAPGAAVAAGPSFEGWAEPPAYTGRPTLYLPEVPGGAPVAVPEGTQVTLRVYGSPERFDLDGERLGRDAGRAGRGGAGDRRGGVPGRGERRGDARAAPAGRSAPGPSPWSRTGRRRSASRGPVEAAPTGETRLPYEGKDDHGIAGAARRDRARPRPGRPPLRAGRAAGAAAAAGGRPADADVGRQPAR